MIKVGDKVQWEFTRRSGDTLRVYVKVHDHREIFGRSEFLISPMLGHGKTWVQESTLHKAGES